MARVDIIWALKLLSLMHPKMQVLCSDNKNFELTYRPGKRGDKISHLLSLYFIYTVPTTWLQSKSLGAKLACLQS